jgi:trans-aconitate 2-methyltransferase
MRADRCTFCVVGEKMMSWTAQYAKQYIGFEDERTRPVQDLVAGVPLRDARVAIDLGCGPGNSTEVLAARFPGAVISGLDSSADMIVAARKRLPDLQFEVGGIQDWDSPGPYDVILANASLQWVPDHAKLYPRLVSKVAAGGALAVQTPDNLDEPAHRLMREVAAAGPWAAKLSGVERTARENAAWYYALLRPHCTRLDVWRTTYYHPLAGGSAAVVEWFKGSGLRPFLSPLSKTEQAAYLEQYQAEVAKAYPSQTDGTVLLPFPRLFIVATR